jgi:hypothetical protein
MLHTIFPAMVGLEKKNKQKIKCVINIAFYLWNKNKNIMLNNNADHEWEKLETLGK